MNQVLETSSSSCATALHYNSDILGPGIRVAIYIQATTTAILVNAMPSVGLEALWTLTGTSFALIVAALLEVGFGRLTLLEGVLVSQLTWFTMFGMFLGLAVRQRKAHYSSDRWSQDLLAAAFVAQTHLSMILTICMWALIPKLPLSECAENSEVKFVILFGLQLPAQTTGRIVALAFASIILFLYSCTTAFEMIQWMKKKSKKNQEERQNITHSRRMRQTCWPDDSFTITMFITQVSLLAYFVSTTEMTIRKSNGVILNSSAGGFGQVLSLIAATFPVLKWLMKKLCGAGTTSPPQEIPLPNRFHYPVDRQVEQPHCGRIVSNFEDVDSKSYIELGAS